MRKTLIALMLAAALPTVAMAMPEGAGPMGEPSGHMMGGPGHGGEHGPRGKGGPFSQLDLSKEQRQQIGKLMGDQWHARKDLVKKYLDKQELAQIALGRKLTLYDRSLDMHVSNLRKKIGPHPDGRPRIVALRSRGYYYSL